MIIIPDNFFDEIGKISFGICLLKIVIETLHIPFPITLKVEMLIFGYAIGTIIGIIGKFWLEKFTFKS